MKAAQRARSAGEVDRDPLREHGRDDPRPRPGPARRDGPEARRHDRRRCGCKVVADGGAYPAIGALPAVPHPHDGPGRLRDPQGRVQRRGAPPPTPRRRPRTVAPAVPRRRSSSSASWTSRPTSSGSTRSRSASRTSSRPSASRSRRSPAPTTTSASTPRRSTRRAASPGYDELRAEQQARRDRGDRVLLGIGVSAYVEVTAGGLFTEYGAVEVHDDGTRHQRRSARPSHGQGHETAFAMIVAASCSASRWSDVRSCSPTPALVPRGSGTMGSRSLQIGGSRGLQARAPRCSRRRSGSPPTCSRRTSTTSCCTRTAGSASPACPPPRSPGASSPTPRHDPGDVAPTAGSTPALAAALDFNQGEATFPFGAHVAVVEVDTETGEVDPGPPRRGRRLRSHPQPAARRRPAARRDRAGDRAGALRGRRVRRRRQPAHGQPHRLRDAERGRAAVASRRRTPRPPRR